MYSNLASYYMALYLGNTNVEMLQQMAIYLRSIAAHFQILEAHLRLWEILQETSRHKMKVTM